MPMRFADESEAPIDIFQATTQMTVCALARPPPCLCTSSAEDGLSELIALRRAQDESGQPYPDTFNKLIDGALGPLEAVGFFTANCAPTAFARARARRLR
jgi:hypothetical protein